MPLRVSSTVNGSGYTRRANSEIENELMSFKILLMHSTSMATHLTAPHYVLSIKQDRRSLKGDVNIQYSKYALSHT